MTDIDFDLISARSIAPGTAATVSEARLRSKLAKQIHTGAAAEIWLQLGLLLASEERLGEAKEAFRQASQDAHAAIAVRAAIHLALLCEDQEPLERLVESAPQRWSARDDAAAFVDLAKALEDAGHLDGAADLLHRVRSEAPPPEPRSEEKPQLRRARAVAALRLARIAASHPTRGDDIEGLLEEAVAANEPSVTPVAALELADRRAHNPYEGCAIDDLLRIAWGYNHPEASLKAGRRLVELYEDRGLREPALEVIAGLISRGEKGTTSWARKRRRELLQVEAPVFNAPSAAPADDGARNAVRTGRPRLRRTLLIGAGSGARRLLHEVSTSRVEVMGLLDDYITSDVLTHPVIGRIDDLPQVLANRAGAIDEVLLAIPSAPPELRLATGMCCASAGVGLRVLPNPNELLVDRDYVGQLRRLRIEETYGGAPLVLDHSAGDAVRDKSVLILGAGGTIGAEIARQVVQGRPRHLTIVDRAETALVQIAEELTHERGSRWTFPVLADSVNRIEMRTAMDTHRPEVVVIAAGINHAHLAGDSLLHTARVNVLGPWIAAQEAAAAGAGKIILVSSDNAALRRGAFDSTKALAERAVLGVGTERTQVAAVRLCNVFRTSGAVIDRFERQLRYMGPIEVTEKRAQRRYLNVHEAARWVLRVAARATESGVYAVNDGVRVKTIDLAHRLIRLNGLEPDVDVQIVFNGPREGEKVETRLWAADERVAPTDMAEVMRVAGSHPPLSKLQEQLADVERRTDLTADEVARMMTEALETPRRRPAGRGVAV